MHHRAPPKRKKHAKQNGFWQQAGMFFFRDSAGNEVDLILEKNETIFAIEIKATNKPDSSHFSGLKYWQKNARLTNGFLVCTGRGKYDPPAPFDILEWHEVGDI
jgi:uncharacterized protein